MKERSQPALFLFCILSNRVAASNAKAAEDCRTPRRFAIYGAYGVPKGLGVRQSSAALALNFREPKGFTRIPLRNNLNRRNYLGICFV